MVGGNSVELEAVAALAAAASRCKAVAFPIGHLVPLIWAGANGAGESLAPGGCELSLVAGGLPPGVLKAGATKLSSSNARG